MNALMQKAFEFYSEFFSAFSVFPRHYGRGRRGNKHFEFYSVFIRAFPNTAIGAGVAKKIGLKPNSNYLIRPINRTAMICFREKALWHRAFVAKQHLNLFGIHSRIPRHCGRGRRGKEPALESSFSFVFIGMRDSKANNSGKIPFSIHSCIQCFSWQNIIRQKAFEFYSEFFSAFSVFPRHYGRGRRGKVLFGIQSRIRGKKKLG